MSTSDADREIIAMRQALIHARSFIIQAINQAVKLPGFDPASHVVVREIDAALAGRHPPKENEAKSKKSREEPKGKEEKR